MHNSVLSVKQKSLLPLLAKFSDNFGLVGGTALALWFGHRRSVDFDLATTKKLNSNKIRELIREKHSIQDTLINEKNEMSVVVNSVKFTFFNFPFTIRFGSSFGGKISLPDITTLAAMKAFALGRRAKWKDYVDLYFVFKKYPISKVATKANNLFKGEFNEKLFREQLSYFDDVDFSEEVDFITEKKVSNKSIKDYLIQVSLQKK